MNVPLLLVGVGIIAVPWLLNRQEPLAAAGEGSPSTDSYSGTRGMSTNTSGTATKPVLDPALVNYASADKLSLGGLLGALTPTSRPATAQDSPGASLPPPPGVSSVAPASPTREYIPERAPVTSAVMQRFNPGVDIGLTPTANWRTRAMAR